MTEVIVTASYTAIIADLGVSNRVSKLPVTYAQPASFPRQLGLAQISYIGSSTFYSIYDSSTQTF